MTGRLRVVAPGLLLAARVTVPQARVLLSPSRPPDWRDGAACTGTDAEDFFPEQGRTDQAARARMVCAGCHVRGECLAFAMDMDIPDGIWGGLLAEERAALRRARREWLGVAA